MTAILKTELSNNLLGLDKSPSETKVVVAMSGGVDSSVVAGLMKMNGYKVVGITLQLYDYAQINKKPGTCWQGKIFTTQKEFQKN
jgi:tRNA-specific 2-thiouridylase